MSRTTTWAITRFFGSVESISAVQPVTVSGRGSSTRIPYTATSRRSPVHQRAPRSTPSRRKPDRIATRAEACSGIHLDLQPLQTELTERVLGREPHGPLRHAGTAVERPGDQADTRRRLAYLDGAERAAGLDVGAHDVERHHLPVRLRGTQRQLTICQRIYGGHAVNATR